MPENKCVSDYPLLLKEWDYDRNTGINPSKITAGSQKKVWWICEKHHHSWCAVIRNRVKGSECPYCSGLYVSVGINDLATLYPELAKE